MSAELQIINTPVFPTKIKSEEIIKSERIDVKEIEMSESRNLKIRNHFERLKKKLRKRAVSIL